MTNVTQGKVRLPRLLAEALALERIAVVLRGALEAGSGEPTFHAVFTKAIRDADARAKRARAEYSATAFDVEDYQMSRLCERLTGTTMGAAEMWQVLAAEWPTLFGGTTSMDEEWLTDRLLSWNLERHPDSGVWIDSGWLALATEEA